MQGYIFASIARRHETASAVFGQSALAVEVWYHTGDLHGRRAVATSEHSVNDALAAQLRLCRRSWNDPNVVVSETTGMLEGVAKRPDILVVESEVSPVSLETEFAPAVSLEKDATSRLGARLYADGRRILSVVAIRIPARFRTVATAKLPNEIKSTNDFEFALYTGESPLGHERWPATGWLRGAIPEIAVVVQFASVPPAVIEAAANQLVQGVSQSAGMLAGLAKTHQGAVDKICELLHQHEDEQTLRMAATIIANAMVFQATLAGGRGKLGAVRSLEELRDAKQLTKQHVIAEWRKILEVNYWPIFAIAKDLLLALPSDYAKRVIERLASTAEDLVASNLMRSHDLTGAVFQKLIADRKFLAAYYTTPASAALLAGLAIAHTSNPRLGTWGDKNAVKGLRIGDLACGTGTLLSAAYQRVSQLHELHGGDAEEIHPTFMKDCLVGCDILPAASHLTAAMLSGSHPRVLYEGSSILTLPFGKQDDGSVALGSIDLLDVQRPLEIIEITATKLGAKGKEEANRTFDLPDESFDFLIMNPPFTRSTGHEAAKVGVPRPMFAAFGTDEKTQKLMASATARLTKGTAHHGNAGEASIFLVLADRKLREGGTLALVMPLSLVAGESWQACRDLLLKRYGEIVVLSIAGEDGNEMSFSADTGMGECLLIARKTIKRTNRVVMGFLKARPPYPLLGALAAQEISKVVAAGGLRKLEDGPIGGTAIRLGDEDIGELITAPVRAGDAWTPTRVADVSLAQAAYQLACEDTVWLPTVPRALAKKLSMVRVDKIARIGPYHSDIDGNAGKAIRGPFSIVDLPAGRVATYPSLWSHNAPRECTLSFEPDSEARVKSGKNAAERAVIDQKVIDVWATASHAHFNQNFRFNSQSTAMQYTPALALGGRAWLSLKLSSASMEKALVMWGNTSIGLLVHWHISNKQQSGRGNIGRTALAELPVLDVSRLTVSQLTAADKLFAWISSRPLLPFNEIDRDANRAELDQEFLGNILLLPASLFAAGGPLELLRKKLAAEPSITGGKA